MSAASCPYLTNIDKKGNRPPSTPRGYITSPRRHAGAPHYALFSSREALLTGVLFLVCNPHEMGRLLLFLYL